MIKRSMIFILVISHLLFSRGFAQVALQGGRGLMRVLSADVINPTDIYISSYLSMYLEKTGPQRMAKYYRVNLNGTFGLSKYFEMSCSIVPYQDDQYHLFGRFGDSELAAKLLLPFSSSNFQIGIQNFFKFPTAKVANVPYEVFSSNKFGWGGRALFTFNFSKTTNIIPFKLIANIGYYDHNITDEFFTSKIDQMLFGLGINIPVRSQQFFIEYTGEIFNNADSVNFNENSSRISTGTKILGPFGLILDVVADVGLSKRSSIAHSNLFHKDYSYWRVWLGVTYRFTLFKYFDKSEKLAKEKKEQEKKKLERIKKRRQKATSEMDEMKEILKKKNPETH